METLSHSTNTKSVSKRIEILFTRFAAFYGYVWRNQFPNDKFLNFAKKEWEEGLLKFDDSILERAINECRDFSDLPPTLPKMINNCRQIRKRNEIFKMDEGKSKIEGYGTSQARQLLEAVRETYKGE